VREISARHPRDELAGSHRRAAVHQPPQAEDAAQPAPSARAVGARLWGFTELSMFGEWRTTVSEYVAAVACYQQIGRLQWAAPMDWMCEPWIIEKTGLSVREHQERTVQNYLDLRDEGPFIPVLQGWTLEDYHDCVDLYASAGVDLTLEPVVGLGSVCRRQATLETARIVRELAWRDLRLHGFGVKLSGLRLYREHLVSCDSLAWSYRARNAPPLPGHSHKSCANCLDFALLWREKVLGEPHTLWEVAA
jgi:hypothetical protein